MRRSPSSLPTTTALSIALLVLAVGVAAALPPANEPPPRPPSAMPPRPAADATDAPFAPIEPAIQAGLRALAPVVAPSTRLAGVCLDWQTMAPLAGCTVRVHAADGTAQQAFSDADGHFLLELPSHTCADRTAVLLCATAAGRVGARGHVPLGGRTLQVRLRRGVEVGGDLLDEAQVACAGATVQLQLREPPARDDGLHDEFTTLAMTRGDGTFLLPLPLPAGPIEVTTPFGPDLVGCTTFELEGTRRHLALRCAAVDRARSIAGAVLGADGAPAAGALVLALPEASPEATPIAWTRSDGDGGFLLYAPKAAPTSVWLRADDGVRSRTTAAIGPVSWPAGALQLQLVPAHGVVLEVYDADTGAPVERFAVQGTPTGGLRGPVEHHPLGRCRLPAPGSGRQVLAVWPDGGELLPSLPVVFRAGDGPLRIGLRHAQPLAVQLLDADGLPLHDVAVELLRPGGALVRDLATILRQGGSGAGVTLRLDRATTDPEGRATVRWCDDGQTLLLRWHGPRVLPGQREVTASGGPPLRIELPAQGTLDLELAGADGARVTLQPFDGADPWPPCFAEPLQLDGNGRHTGAAPVGRFQLRLWRRSPDGAAWLPAPQPLDAVQLRAGETTCVRLDLGADATPASIVGSVTVDGAPPAEVELCYGDGTDGEPVRELHALRRPVERDGTFRFEGVPAGRCRLRVLLVDGGRRVAAPLEAWRDLPAGSRWVLPPATLTTTTVCIQLDGGDGAQPPRGDIELEGRTGTSLLAPLDEHGTATFRCVPVDHYEVRWRAPTAAAATTATAHPTTLGTLGVAGRAPVQRRFTLR